LFFNPAAGCLALFLGKETDIQPTCCPPSQPPLCQHASSIGCSSPVRPESLGSKHASATTLADITRDFRAGKRMHSHPKAGDHVYLTHVWLYA